jgi:VCBS repeat-containing protein
MKMTPRSSRRRGHQGVQQRVCAAAAGLAVAGLLATVGAPIYSADPGLPFTEDFVDDSLKDAAGTTADWNTTLGQLVLPGSGASAASLTGETFGEGSVPLTFGTATTRALALGDLDGDGHLDLVQGILGHNRVYLNDGAGNFTHVFTGSQPEGNNTRAVAIGDVNRDGSLDFVAANFGGHARLYLNDGTGANYVVQPITSQTWSGDDIALVDINGNGLLDVVIAAGDNTGPQVNVLVLNTGDPVHPFGPEGSAGIVLDSSVVEGSRGVTVGDVDNDGDIDIIFLNAGVPDRIYLQVNPGTCPDEVCFVHEQIDPADLHHKRAGVLGDLNGNGFLDLVVVSRDDGEDGKIYYNQLEGPDTNPYTQPGEVFLPAIAGAQPLDLKLADLNRNGLLDIVVVLSGFPHRNRIYFNDENNPGSFLAPVEIGPEPDPAEEFQTNALAIGDVNNDGKLDLVFGNQAVQPDNDARPTHLFLNAGVADGDEKLQLRAHATSVAVNAGLGGTIASVRLTADTGSVGPQFHNYVDFWVSSDGGAYWAPIRPDGKPISIASPGNDLRWRAFLHSVSPFEAGGLAVNELTLDVNELPVAVNDDYLMNQGDVLNEAAPGVLANDSDPDAGIDDELTAVLVQQPANGSLVLNADGSFTYTPTASFFGQDTFTYRASDGALSNVATVTITVNGLPVANDDSFGVETNTTRNVAAPGVLANDADPDGDELTAELVSGPSHGTLQLEANGSFSYIPDTDFEGTDTFTYRANDGSATSNVATVTLTVVAGNEAPVAADDDYTVDANTTLDVPAPGVLANDTDPEGDDLTAVLVQGTANGTLTLNADGSFSYEPNAGFSGADSFTYQASDGVELSNVATVSITVSAVIVPTAPSFTSTPVTAVTEGQEYLYNITTEDADGDDVTISAVALPGWLTLTDNGDGTAQLRGTPAAGQVGQHTVELRVEKAPAVDGLSDTQAFVITVSAASTPPPPPPPPPSSGGRSGGGSLGLEALALLLLAAAAGGLRRRRRIA